MLPSALAPRQLLGQAQLSCSSRVSLFACALATLLLQRGGKTAQVCLAQWFVSVPWYWESSLHPSDCFLLLDISWISSTEQRKVGVCKRSLMLVWCWSLPCWGLRKQQCRGVVVCWEGMPFTFVMLHLLFDKAKLWG